MLLSEGCPRQDSNLRSRLRRPGALIHRGVSGVLPGLLPEHLCLRLPPCRVVESTIDSTSHPTPRSLSKKLTTARIAMWAQVEVDTKTNEIPMFAPLLDGFANSGC